MDRYMVGFVALDQVLGRFPRSVMRIPLEVRVRSDLFDDDSADPPSLGIPSHMVTDFEVFRHCGHPISDKLRSIPSGPTFRNNSRLAGFFCSAP
jgi:hypothetical protein